MCALTNNRTPNLIRSLLRSTCTRCRRGEMFQVKNPYRLRTTLKMNDHCPVCAQPLDMEPGFYYGTNMISYGLAVVVCVTTLLLWWATIGFSLHDTRFFWWMGINALALVALQPPLMRISRTVWLSFFVPYSPHWQVGDIVEQYSVNKEQQNNW